MTTDASASPSADRPAERGRRFYGWQIILVNGASLAVASVGWQQESLPMIIGGIGGQTLGGPVVHAIHGRWGASLTSFAINTFVPMSATAVGVAIAATNVSKDVQATVSTQSTDPQVYEDAAARVIQAAKTEPFIGYVTGVVLATAVDSLLNGFEPSAADEKERTSARIVPRIDAGPGRAYVGVGGTF